MPDPLLDRASQLVTEAVRLDLSTREDEWLTVKEFAARKRVHAQTVREWIRQRKVIAERTAGERGHWRILQKAA